MGDLLNTGSGRFIRSLNSQIYVDKSELIAHTNKIINTQQCYACLSRPEGLARLWQLKCSMHITGVAKKLGHCLIV